MRALRAVWEGQTASFRYPHFMVGRQPSYPVPPPATVYGLLAACRGAYFDPGGLRVAYRFTHRGRVDDVEHQHIATPGSGRPAPALGGEPVNLVATVNPVLREMFVRPRLEIYLDGQDLEAWRGWLRSPRFVPTLGRSQDLGAFTQVVLVDLSLAPEGVADHCLAPPGRCRRVAQSLSLPAFLPPDGRERGTLSRFDWIEGPATVAPAPEEEGEGVWVDPDAPGGRNRAVVWLTPWLPWRPAGNAEDGA